MNTVEWPSQEVSDSEDDNGSQVSAVGLASRSDLQDLLNGRTVSGDYVGTETYSNPFDRADNSEGVDVGGRA